MWQCHFAFWKALAASSSEPELPAGRSEKREVLWYNVRRAKERLFLEELVSECVGSAQTTAPPCFL